MIPEKLTIKGIYSYQKEEVIDFEHLISAGIFGIFGSVGSGKSTILEAISYALYGETERLNNKDSKLYNMMNLRSNEMEIDFVFRHQSVKYRFVAYARRNSRNFEDISKSDRKAYQWKSKQWVPMESANAEYVTGLKYDHFKQIVIIPQGKFNEFVTLSPADRTKMLRELFPLERFDLKDTVNRLFSVTKNSITSIEGRLHELDEYKPELKEEFQKEIVEKKSSLEKQKKQLNEKEKERVKFLELKELLLEFQNNQEKLQLLNSQKTKYIETKQQVEKYEKTRLTYAHLISRLKELNEEVFQIEEKQKSLVEMQENHTQQKKQYESIVSQIQDKTGDEDEHKRQIAELEKIAKIKGVEVELTSVNEFVEDLQTKKIAEENKIKSLTDETQKLKIQLGEMRKSLLDEGQLNLLNGIFKDEDNLRHRLKAAKSELEKVERLISELARERTDIVVSTFVELQTDKEPEDVKINEALELISIALKDVDQKILYSEKLKDDLSLKTHLAKHAKELKDGEKCPLCGAFEHPEPYTDDKIAADRNVLADNIEKQQKTKELLLLSFSKLDGLKKRFKQEGSAVNERKQHVELTQKALDDCIAQQKGVPLKLSRDELSDSLQNLEDQKQKITSLEKAISEAEKEMSNQKALSQIQSQLDEKKNLQSQLKGKIQALQDEVSEKWLIFSNNDIALKLKAVKQSLESQRNATVEVINQEKQLDRIKIEIEQYTKTQTNLNQKNAEISGQIDSQLTKDNFGNIEEVQKILSAPIDIDQAKLEIEQFNKDLHLLENKVAELKAKVGNQTFDDDKFKEVLAVYESLKVQISSNEEQIGAFQSKLEELNKKLAIKNKLEKELGELEKRKRNLDVLNRLFRGDGFVRYVSQIYLQQLCSIANERFKKLTQNQLELDIDEKYNFIVRDFLHEGKTRLLKTLSGGQTFQAALSLAMALSEQIQQYQNVKQQFFFMDEGFGSLDKESLSLVFDTLKQLRKEERTVGIISHVEELQTEIDHAIFVKNDVEKGSSINTS